LSTTLPVQAPPSDVAGTPEPIVPLRARRAAGPVAFVVGSSFSVIGMTLHVKGSPEDEALVRDIAEHSTQWVFSHFFQSFGMVLMAVGALAALRLARGRGAVLTAVGVGLTAVGGTLMALGDMAHGAVAYALVDHVTPAASLEIQKAFFVHPAFGGMSILGMLAPIGVMVLGAGVLRSRALPRWAALALMLGPILIQVAFATGVPVALLGIPFVVGAVALARAVVRDASVPSA
jgi:hypothetical protein